jgi:hypothetical protein
MQPNSNQLQFNSTYALVIVALLLLVCFCRQVLQALAAGADLLDKCSAAACDCHCIAALVSGQAARRTVAVYLLFLPIVFNAVYFWHQSFSKFDWTSSVVLVDFRSVRPSNSTLNSKLVQTGYVELDLMFVVMPFALTASLNCWLWLAFTKDAGAALAPDTVWDDSLPEPVAYYELAYYGELLSLNFSFIASESSGRTALEVVYASLAITLVECSFVAGARYRRDDAAARVTTLALTLLLVAAALPLVAMVQPACPVAEALASVHAFCVCAVTGLHFAANGEATASSILAVRVGTTVLASLAHLAVLVHGRNRACLN